MSSDHAEKTEKSTASITIPDDGIRFWKEEKVDGAVYGIYLKKVKYTVLSELEPADSDQVSHLQWQTQRIRVVKAGTLERLVESLSSETGELDSSYVNVFLATYRTFASAKQVLQLILDRYLAIDQNTQQNDQMHEKIKKTYRSVTSMWLDTYPEDFREPPNYPCLTLLEKFAAENMPTSDLAIRSQHKKDKFMKEEEGEHHDGNIDFHLNLCDEVDFMIDTEYQKPLDFMSIPNAMFAQQLTYMDAQLFKKVLPHHCLGSVWSNRKDKKKLDAPSVVATVDQFNRVSYRVIATVLKQPDMKASQRAKIIAKWIDIAQELRVLKNFSSLKAIVSGLQSNSVFRLKRVWSMLPKEVFALFEELSSIFSEENNQMAHRELLNKEGTAKYAATDTWGRNWKRRTGHSHKRKAKSVDGITVQGTVPYLGTFLTDLTMIDTATPDLSEDGLINFEKRRKEFEVLAQIRLYQSAAHIYNLQPNERFMVWFSGVRVYNDNESYELSCAIEPADSPAHGKLKKKASALSCVSGLMRTPSMGSNSSLNQDSRSSDSSSLADSLSLLSTSQISTDSQLKSPLLSPGDITEFKSPDACVIKVKLDTGTEEDTSLYKSIMLGNGDHTGVVIKKVLEKYNLEADNPTDYSIYQVLPDGDLHIPDKANVFYAINNNVKELRFMVCRKSLVPAHMTMPYRGKRTSNKNKMKKKNSL